MMMAYTGLIEAKNLFRPSLVSDCNSIMASIPEDACEEGFVTRLKDIVYEGRMKACLRKAISEDMADGDIRLEYKSYEYAVRRFKPGTDLVGKWSVGKAYENVLDEEIGSPSQPGYVPWSKAYERGSVDTSEYISVEKKSLTKSWVECLSHVHPYKKIRSWCRNAISLIEMGIDRPRLTTEQISNALRSFDGDHPDVDTGRSRMVREVLPLIYLSANMADYGIGLKLLMPQDDGSGDKNLKSYERLKIYRKMGPLYAELVSSGAAEVLSVEEFSWIWKNSAQKFERKRKSEQEADWTKSLDKLDLEFMERMDRAGESLITSISRGEISILPQVVNGPGDLSKLDRLSDDERPAVEKANKGLMPGTSLHLDQSLISTAIGSSLGIKEAIDDMMERMRTLSTNIDLQDYRDDYYADEGW
jgi:hypothetical protein